MDVEEVMINEKTPRYHLFLGNLHKSQFIVKYEGGHLH